MKAKVFLLTILLLVLGVTALSYIFPKESNKVLSFLGIKFFKLPEENFKLGLDLQGGIRLVYSVDLSKVAEKDKTEVVEGLRDVIERRVNLFGVKEPVIQVIRGKEGYRLNIELAGHFDQEAVTKTIGSTPVLEFREERDLKETEKILAKQKEVKEALEKGKKLEEIKDWELAFKDPYFKSTKLTGRYLKSARLEFGGTTGQEPVVALEFTKEGAKIFEELTEKNVGKRLAIYIDNQLISAPVVQEKITGGKAQITGNFTIEEAKKLAQNLSAGALPVPIKLMYQERVGPSLGQDSLEKSLKAGAGALIGIFGFMIIFYRIFGLLSSLSLVFYGIIVLALLKLIGATLTLAGIGGFILSLGMAIDANILIGSRLKEELKEVKNLSFAIAPAFQRAWPAIRDGNITTIAVALILFFLGSGFVQGFGLTLALGLGVNIFTAFVVTKLLLTLISLTPLAKLKRIII